MDTIGNPVAHLEFHGTYLGTRWGLTLDASESYDTVFKDKMVARTGFSISDDANTPVGAIGWFMSQRGAMLSIMLELGDPSPTTNADVNLYGVAAIQSIYDMDLEDRFD